MNAVQNYDGSFTITPLDKLLWNVLRLGSIIEADLPNGFLLGHLVVKECLPGVTSKVKHGVITQPQFSQRTIPYSFISKEGLFRGLFIWSNRVWCPLLMLTIHIIVSMENIEAFVIVHIKVRYKEHSEATANQSLQDIKQNIYKAFKRKYKVCSTLQIIIY